MMKQSVDKSSYKIVFVALIVTAVVVGSVIYFNPTSFKGSTSPPNTTSTTAQLHSNTTTTATQFSRTISLTTPFTTSFPFNNNFSEQAGGVLVSVWVEERGILLNLTYTPSFNVGGTFKYFVSMTNVNNSSHLSLLEYYGKFNITIYNEKGNAVYWEWSPYATGPTGPPPPNFIKGYSWALSDTWDTGTNLPNQLGPGNPPHKQTPGNYTIIVEGVYYNIDLNEIEQVELQAPLIITTTATSTTSTSSPTTTSMTTATSPPTEFLGPTLTNETSGLKLEVTLSSTSVNPNDYLWIRFNLTGAQEVNASQVELDVFNSQNQQVWGLAYQLGHSTQAPLPGPQGQIGTLYWQASKDPHFKVDVTPGTYTLIIGVTGENLTIKTTFNVVTQLTSLAFSKDELPIFATYKSIF